MIEISVTTICQNIDLLLVSCKLKASDWSVGFESSIIDTDSLRVRREGGDLTGTGAAPRLCLVLTGQRLDTDVTCDGS